MHVKSRTGVSGRLSGPAAWLRGLHQAHQRRSCPQQLQQGLHTGWLEASSRAVQTEAARRADVVALGNLCVDVVLPVPELPPPDPTLRRQLLDTLQASQDNTDSWEVGGSCNFVVAAARLGLRVGTIGHTGDDAYGRFMEQVLQDESVEYTERILSMESQAPSPAQLASAPAAGNAGIYAASYHSNGSRASCSSSSGISTSGSVASTLTPQSSTDSAGSDQTLICFVMVDPHSRHAFCSRYDFGPWPLLGGLSQLPAPALQALSSTSAVFLNGFVFDELPLESVRHACKHAINNGASIFFDPGPRCFTMLEGDRRHALDEVLDLSEVVLMTEEEAVTVTGHVDPEASARAVLARPGALTQWCVVKLGGAGAVLANKRTGQLHRVPGFKVEVADTVGCGDSFAAAVVLGYIAGASEGVTLTLANAVGAATATGRGAGRNVATARMVRDILQDAARRGGPHGEEVAASAEQALQLMQAGSRVQQAV